MNETEIAAAVMKALGLKRCGEPRERSINGYAAYMTADEANRFEEWIANQPLDSEYVRSEYELRTMVASGKFDFRIVDAAMDVRRRAFTAAKQWCEENLK